MEKPKEGRDGKVGGRASGKEKNPSPEGKAPPSCTLERADSPGGPRTEGEGPADEDGASVADLEAFHRGLGEASAKGMSSLVEGDNQG